MISQNAPNPVGRALFQMPTERTRSPQGNMEKVNLGYSAKNIPIPTKNSYLKAMITKIESFVKRLQWKAFFYDRDDDCANADTTKNYRFKSERTPPQHDGLLAFETDLYRLAKNIKFRYVRNQFQTKLSENAKRIKNSEHMFVALFFWTLSRSYGKTQPN